MARNSKWRSISTVLYSYPLAECNSTVLYFWMSRTDPQINIRLPDELKAKLREEARKNTRTMNAEIVNRLEMSFASTARLNAGVEKASFDRDLLEEIRLALHVIENEMDDFKTFAIQAAHSSAGATDGALPEDAIKAILETREMVGEMHEAVKAPLPAPKSWPPTKKS